MYPVWTFWEVDALLLQKRFRTRSLRWRGLSRRWAVTLARPQGG
jgi:hypothetical protein